MGRIRSAVATLPALIPGACVVFLAFQAGGFYPSSWAPIAAIGTVALAVRLVTAERPFAGLSAWTAVAASALALLGVWILVSAEWSHAPGRAVVEFGRLLAYLVVFVLCASLTPRQRRVTWAVRGVAFAIFVVCVAALVSRLRPDLWSGHELSTGRLDFPVTYWNGLGLLAGIGLVLGLHLSASDREPRPVRVLAAALAPVAACTVYFTLSRGAIAAAALGTVLYLLLGFSRATPGALLALVPPCVIAVTAAYGADLLVTSDFASSPGRAQGRDVAGVLAGCVAGAVLLRAIALLLDRAMERLPGPGRLSVPVRAGFAVAGIAVVAGITIAAGAPGYVSRQFDAFLSATPRPVGTDLRERLTIINNNGRVAHWRVALDAWHEEPLHGTGAGTFQNTWNRDRPSGVQVLDAHSLYLETLGELGIVGFALLICALAAIVGGLAWRLRGRDRQTVAAVLAAVVAWAVHAGVDWDWELMAVSVWMFGLSGIALAPDPARAPATRGPAPLVRLVAALGCLVLALSPAALWRSQARLDDALAAFGRGDCRSTIDAALDSLDAVSARAEPWELIAYCDYRLGQPRLALGAVGAAVARDPGDWEYRYAEALVRGAIGQDPRPAADAALRLNPLQPEARQAARAFRRGASRAWQAQARRLPLHID